MSKPLKSAAAVLAGAVVLASGAYALGSERGAGTASARDGTAAGAPARFGYRRRAGGPELDALAAKLGVSASKLQAALQDLRPDKPGTDPRSRFAASLASALALPPSKVNAALAKLGPPRGELRGPPPEFVNGLASALGLDAGKVRAAFVKLRSQGRGPGAGPDAFLPRAGLRARRRPGQAADRAAQAASRRASAPRSAWHARTGLARTGQARTGRTPRGRRPGQGARSRRGDASQGARQGALPAARRLYRGACQAAGRRAGKGGAGA